MTNEPPPASPGAALAAMRKPRTGQCPECGAPWETTGSRRKYCSHKCARRAGYRAWQERQQGK